MTIEVAYPCVRGSLEPRALTARQIWTIAEQMRRQFLPRYGKPSVDVDRLMLASRSMRVNGIVVAAHWDFNRQVRDKDGREVLGMTEADPALPGVVLISLNTELIAERDYLKRSTLAHELGHALFDGPSMLRTAGRPAFCMVTPDEAHLATRTGGDWREFRANEFMGALLVPRPLLHRELVRRSIALSLPLLDRGEDQPVLRAAGDPVRVEELLFDLAERFGVSTAFIGSRLRRYALVQ